MDNIINCKSIRDEYIKKIKEKDLKGCTVAFVQVGENQASNIYVRNKIKLCKEVGIEVEHYHLSEDTTEYQLLTTIDMLNKCNVITGIMVQLPLPKHIDENKIINAINPNKDIDGFSDYHKGKLLNGDKDAMLPCTPKGIMAILKEEGIDLKGKNVVIVGRSNIVGKPLTVAMINESATVTCCNSKTDRKFLTNLIFSSDIFISAIGKANYFNEKFFLDNRMLPEYLEDTIAIDVGINKDENNKLCGDIDKELYPYFKRVTSVPGGVGVVTTLTVVSNIIKLYENKHKKEVI
ncbi:bifunctional 5,10-methylenetetrahydrofolate dehydrogenase/5,10-methenyltetrahydrofolate cyclohydrolase [uncultured Clostridium sp.]|uniref:bifunctional 5,10-methylenetetrahydrofolate dehydrogenase/5,10-methenyltetrahydrofolate cyclohydrolase n=1 Tax=uncultured Clostridium sp. TaxID=59620 RepID=UPI002635B44C|nr:bifunctional 5,10-methylenetetrahydrofolate dehydrogenase/5,10-methenyltetrahydrofolate cyclohydrolase [uncultured Clostridium sp.]